MKILHFAALGAAFLVSAAGVSVGASAQDVPRVYDVGPVWTISRVEVKPGQGDAYMAYLNRSWKATRLANQKSGHELAYKIMTLEDSREGEPNLLLMIEYKNHAAFDRSLDETDAVNKAVEASMGKMMPLADRETMRKQHGTRTAQELVFKK
jgi:quinol monooxygenase YgiN